jgi:inhibitor of cysteine peptidase
MGGEDGMRAQSTALRVAALVIVVCVAALSAACGGAPATPTPNFATSAGFNDTDPGERSFVGGISIAAGGEAYLIESDNPTTGYRWSFRVPPGVTQAGSTYKGPSPSASPPLGAGGTRTFTFSVPQAGTYVVTGLYARPWEPTKPAKKVRFSIYANPSSWPAPGVVLTPKSSPGGLGTDVGATFVVDLEENASTGYAWTMKLGPGLTLVHEQVATPAPSPSPMVGVGGQHLWLIRVVKAGTTTVTGIYARPSAAATKNAASFSLTVRASPPGP